jgi:peroxiredoxin
MRNWIIAAAAALSISSVALYGAFVRTWAPQVHFATLDGEKIATSDLRGKVVLVNFWATGCASCVKETPELVETHRKYVPLGYETVAVAVRGDPPGAVAEFARQRALPFKVALDTSGDVARYVGEPDWTELHARIEQRL